MKKIRDLINFILFQGKQKKFEQKKFDRNDIAVIGMACRFPGADNYIDFWNNLAGSKSGIVEIPRERWTWANYEVKKEKDKTLFVSKWLGLLDNIDTFDAPFFHISNREAANMDPQQRIALEVAWNCFEDAGIQVKKLEDRNVGVFVAGFNNDFSEISSRLKTIPYYSTGTAQAMLANRISYVFDLHGPSYMLDTACAGSSTAIHNACQSLKNDECSMALAGGVSLILTPTRNVSFSQMGMLSPTGACKTFDEAADGYVRGEGCAFLLLKKLDDAVADGDCIHAVIKGSAVNHCGKGRTITYPSADAQAEVIKKAMHNSGVPASAVSYIEMHGTGTPKGDPIEFEGLAKAYASLLKEENPRAAVACGLGSVKSNIGHLESAAGIAGVIKVILAMQMEQLPPLNHYHKLNPRITMANTPFYIVDSLKQWKSDKNHPLRAGVSSFGFGGVNTHIVLEQSAKRKNEETADKSYLICISAKSSEILKKKIHDLYEWMESDFAITDISAISSTLLAGREHFEERIAFAVRNTDELKQKLTELHKDTVLEDYIAQAQKIKGLKERKDEIIYSLHNNLNNKKDNRELLEEAAALYMQHTELDWKTLFKNGSKRVHLPGYPFEQQRFAIPLYEDAVNSLSNHVICKQKEGRHKCFVYGMCRFNENTVVENEDNRVIAVGNNDEFIKAIAKVYQVVGTISNEKVNSVEEFTEELKKYKECTNILWIAGNEGSFKKELLNVFAFVKALIKLGYQAKKVKFTMLSVHSCEFAPGEKSYPYAAGLSGFAGTLAKEYPLWNVCYVDADNLKNIPLEKCLFWNSKKYGSTVFVRDQQAYVRELSEIREGQHKTADGPTAFRKNGVYLIIGGAGGVGMLISEYLVKAYDAQLIWIGRREEDKTILSKINYIKSMGKKPVYISANTSTGTDMNLAYRKIKRIYSRINGVIHSVVGRLDESIGAMTTDTFNEILEAKIDSAICTMNALKDEDLDFMLYFSSIASYQKLSGQCGYASGCNFLDEYVKYLNQQETKFPVKVINWGFWGNVGIGNQMPDSAKNKLAALGLCDLNPEYCMKAMEQVLTGSQTQVFYLNVTEDFNEEIVKDEGMVKSLADVTEESECDDNRAVENLRKDICNMFAEEFELPAHKIRTSEHLDLYGLDSIINVNVTEALMKKFNGINNTLLYEYHTIDEITNYIWKSFPDLVKSLYSKAEDIKPAPVTVKKNIALGRQPVISNKKAVGGDLKKEDSEAAIAVIGMSGRFPEADNVDEFWENLYKGKDSITAIPADRWSMDGFYEEDKMKAVEQRKSYCKWGGFLENSTQFDAEFFHISPKDAFGMDPQERLFLEESWKAFEDAGYSKTRIHEKYAGNVGVFAGITRTGYEWYGQELWEKGQPIRPTTAFSSVANRVSYYMDLHGPSMPVDTMCSSSLTAIHLACESIKRKECDIALAGGVNLYTHPSSYIYLSSMMMLSPTGRCHSFGEDADGFVPGEGVGVIILKSLEKAVADGDHIYGVIRGSNINHNGRTNGYTVPNPNAQAKLIKQTLYHAGVNARLLSYVEAHGTGTKLGDPIEIAGLTQAIRPDTKECNYCSIGSVKSNIGHLEAAAGVTGVIKTLLQMQHKTLIKSLHSEVVNSRIDFEHSPFVLQHMTEEWKRPCVDFGEGLKKYPRYAGVSSFGAGGTNAFVLLQEYEEDTEKHN